MNKFIAVFRNELTKFFHRNFILIILSLLIIGILGIGAVYKIIDSNSYQNDSIEPFSEAKSSLNEDMNNLERSIAELESSINNDSLEINQQNQSQLYAELSNLSYLKYEKASYDLAFKYEVNIYNMDYLTESLYQLRDLKILQESRAYTPISRANQIDFQEEFYKEFGDSPTNLYSRLSDAEIESKIESLQNILSKKSYQTYIEGKKTQVLENTFLSEKQKEFALSDLDLELEVNPSGLQYYPGSSDISYWKNVRDTALSEIENGYNEYYTPLTSTELETSQKNFNIAIRELEQSLENTQFSYSDASIVLSFIVSFAVYTIIFIMIILGGSSISQEISTGSIKGLIIAPVKRSKIFFAKLISLFFVGIISIIIAYLTTILCASLFFPDVLSYSILGFSYPVYLLLIYCSKLSLIIVSTCIAFTLSASFSNTSFAVGIAMIIHFGLVGVYNFIKLINNDIHAIIAFLPFEYFDLTQHVLPSIAQQNLALALGNTMKGFTMQVPNYFPFIYWICMVVGLSWTAHNAFTKKDI